jgi:hypothetical protein
MTPAPTSCPQSPRSHPTGLSATFRAVLHITGTGAPSEGRAGRSINNFARVLPVILIILGALVAAPVASASSAWFTLDSAARPSDLSSEPGANEVEQLTVSATGGQFTLHCGEECEEKGREANVFVPFNATAAEIQEGLETLYGAGNATVTGGPGDEAGDTPYQITFTGELAGTAVPSFEALSNFFNIFRLTGGREEAKLTTTTPAQPPSEIVLTAENVGDTVANASKSPITITDILPPGLHATGIAAAKPLLNTLSIGSSEPVACTLETLTCELKGNGVTGELPPFDEVEVRITVDVDPAAKDGELNQASISGAGVQPAHVSRPIAIKAEATPFGVEHYALTNEEEGGPPSTQAGSHPFQQTTDITLNQNADTNPLENTRHRPESSPAGLAKDLSFRWPAGLIGNPNPFPQCTDAQFNHIPESLEDVNSCPEQTAVGVADLTIQEPSTLSVGTFVVPVFNLEPRKGEPARFGFIVEQANAPVFIDTAVRTGSDYGVTVTSSNITQVVGFLGAKVTVWGVPGDPRHDASRGWGCLGATRRVPLQGTCNVSEEEHPSAFLSLPTSCTGPLQSSVLGDSWENQTSADAYPVLATSPMPALDGCNRLPFNPSIRVTPDGTAGSTPTGLNVDVHVPQEETLNAEGLAEAAPRNITVALPEGVAVNPSSGDGLAACSEALAGFTGFGEFAGARTATFTETLPSPLQQAVNFCPDASKIATVTIKTPILPHPIEGAAYLASQNANPFGGLVAMYVVAEDPVSGVLIKLAGNVHITETGQLVTTFENSPQAPFEDAEFHFFGGERAPLATPARCGPYTTNALMTPWSGNPPATPSSTFDITSGPNGSPCPGTSLPFSPSLTGGTLNINAGAFSTLSTTIGREDGQQNMQSVQLHMPAGLSGLLSGVKLCDEADANAGTCGPESLIGETTVSAGVGGDPVSVKGGRVYITEKYASAPFGLSIVNPVKAGPFDLEHDTANPNQQPACDCVVVRAKIEVDPHTAALTITTDPSGPYAIPHLIDGIPVQIKKVNVLINREHFTFNPTNCTPAAIIGSISSDEGASSPVSVPFQPTNCATLKFAPKFAVTTSGKTSKANGASLAVKLTYPQGPAGTYANIAKVKVELPKALPSRLTTLQKACTAAQFEANPAGCPAASIIGHAKAITPLLPVPLEGPAYFVSHGGESFPSLIMVLQGAAPYPVRLDLVGTTFISKSGITSSTFKTIPDAPVGSFELTLPEGKFSALAANGNLCIQKLAMPTEFVAQNGLEIHESTPITVSGCKPAITVTNHKVKGKTATLTVKVPAAGKLVATGKGLSKASKSAKGASTLTLKLSLTNGEQAFLAKHHGRKLRAKIKLTFTPKKGAKLKTSATVLVGG